MYGIFYLGDFVREKVGKYSSTMEHMGIQLYHISKGYTGGTWLIIWVWVNTYRYIFSGMNIHLLQCDAPQL